jgi:anionic cell wall polymer biosynthesis LytR-Cps2A-Psr (LCP) family protein
VRFRDPQRPLESRLDDQQEAVRGLVRAMALPAQLPNLAGLIESLRPEVNTNLSDTESLSLLAAALSQGEAVQFATVPVREARGSQGHLRQLSASGSAPLWPPAQASNP